MTGLIMATMLEAKPFVLGLGLEQLSEKPFPVFGKDAIRLIISGIGKANAAMACTHLILCHNPALVCNPGAAGAAHNRLSLGECLHVDKIIEPDRPDLVTGEPFVHATDILDGYKTAVLATQDRPIRLLSERETLSEFADLVDMEAASIVQVCRRYGRQSFFFKYVSDTPEHSSLSEIRENISRYRDSFFSFFQENALPAILSRATATGA